MTDTDKYRHDFRNQLAIIGGFAEVLLSEAVPGDPRSSDLQEIHKAAMAALALLDRAYPAATARSE